MTSVTLGSEEWEGPVAVAGYPFGSLLDLGEAVESEKSCGQVSQCGHDLWSASGICLLGVFTPGCVSHVVAFVLYAPMLAYVGVYIGGCGVGGIAAGGDPGVFLTDPGSAGSEDVSADAGDLSDVREINVSGVGDPCFPSVDAPVATLLHDMARISLQDREDCREHRLQQRRLIPLDGHNIVETPGARDVLCGVPLRVRRPS